MSSYYVVGQGSIATAGNATATLSPLVRHLLVAFAVTAGDGVGATLTDNNTGLGDAGTYTLVESVSFGGKKLHAYVRDSLIKVAVSTTVTFNPGSASTAAVMAVVAIGDTTAAMPAVLVQGATATGAPGVAAIPLPAAAATTNFMMVALANSTNPPMLTPPTSWATFTNNGTATPMGLAGAYIASGFTGSTVTWGSNPGTSWGAIALEINALALDGTVAPTIVIADGINNLPSESAVVVAGGPGVIYRMRGHDATLGRLVYWNASMVDTLGVQYAGPGALSDVVVFAVQGG